MNNRTIILTLLSSFILYGNAMGMAAMKASLMGMADYTAKTVGEQMEKAGKEITATLPKTVNIELAPTTLWTSILSIAGALLIYRGFTQLLTTWKEAESTLEEEKKARNRSYAVGACNIFAGIATLWGSYTVWNRN